MTRSSKVMAQELSLQLNIPPEPEFLKEDYESAKSQNDEVKMDAIRSFIKGANELGGGFKSYFWRDCDWGYELKEYGFIWNDFQKIYKSAHYGFIDWAKGSISWDAAVDNLIDEIEGYIENSR